MHHHSIKLTQHVQTLDNIADAAQVKQATGANSVQDQHFSIISIFLSRTQFFLNLNLVGPIMTQI